MADNITSNTADDDWVRTWGTSPQAPTDALDAFTDTTLRQVVRISGGGRWVRIRITNEYGTAPLTIGAAHIGFAASDGGIEPGSDRMLTFAGKPNVTVPVGAPILSDPVDLHLPALSKVSISLYLPDGVETCTCHGLVVGTGWSIVGNAVAAPTLPAHAVPLPVRALLSAVEVLPDGPARVIVVIGDSITDGFGSTPGAYHSWPDFLAERLTEHGGPAMSVCNQGISGNRLLNDGIGTSGLARVDRDVLATPGLAYVIVAEGLGDLGISFAPRDVEATVAFLENFPGAPVTADNIIASYCQIIARTRGRGLRVYAATLTPAEGTDIFTSECERERQAVNDWIRTSGAFDAVLDFDPVWSDPASPSRIKDGFHAGDYNHGSDAGYKALADSIDLSLFS